MAPAKPGARPAPSRWPAWRCVLWTLAVAVPALAALACRSSQLLARAVALVLFTRPGTESCVPPGELGRGAALPARPLTEDEIMAFERDGSVVLRGMLDELWVSRLRALVADVFEHPNVWDVLYSRFIANFYCAQKSILVHHTSECGREIAESAPTTAIAAALLRTKSLQVCEPTDALANFRRPSGLGGLIDGCGTTGFHTDDAYIPVGRRDPSRAAVVRLWMPLANFTARHLRFATLNTSAASRARREAAGLERLNGTSYRRNEELSSSGLLSQEGQVIEGDGLRPGDIFAFAGDAPHIATPVDCQDPAAGGCLRLLLSFSGDNGFFAGGRSTGLIPLHDNQTEGGRPRGTQFPTVFPDARAAPWEWAPLVPSLQTLLASLWYAISSGSRAFAGFSLRQQAVYVLRVTWFTVGNFWDRPAAPAREGDRGAGATSASVSELAVPLSLSRHFGAAALGWASGSLR